MIQDDVARANERLWENEVAKGCGFTVPWLDLDPGQVAQFADGTLSQIPDSLRIMTPRSLLWDVKDKNILCLSCGGGQQSAVFGLLGAHVTVVDLSQGQLAGDRKAAEHYHYGVETIHGDMRDLSMLSEDSFDIVYGTAICYVPDSRVVYRQVSRVLRTGGLYRSDWGQPAVHFVTWGGNGYQVTKPYAEKVDCRDDGGIEFRHYMDDIFNGLIETGFSIRRVDDLSRNIQPDPEAVPGTWAHEYTFFGGEFVIVARKEP